MVRVQEKKKKSDYKIEHILIERRFYSRLYQLVYV